MHEDTLTTLLEMKTTTYTCDQEGCDFKTESKRESDNHHGKSHAIAAVGTAGGETLYRFDSKESFDVYVKASNIQNSHLHWDEPGWFRSFWKEDRQGCGCCYDNFQHLHPACWIGFDWQKEIKTAQEQLTELAEFLGEAGDFLLESD